MCVKDRCDLPDNSSHLKKTRARQVVLDKWFPLNNLCERPRLSQLGSAASTRACPFALSHP